jgi:hypothetical protein
MATKKSARQRSANKPSRIDSVREHVGVLTDAEVAAMAGVTSSAVHQYRQRHGIKPALPQGTTRRALERRKSGATSASADKGVRRPTPPSSPKPSPAAADAGGDRRRSKIDDFRDIVGVMTDPEVAERAGVTRTAVQMYRKKHGIPPAGPPGDPAVARSRAPSAAASSDRAGAPSAARPASAPAAARPAASAASSAGGRYGFKVVVSGRQGEVMKIVVAEDAAAAAERARSLGEVMLVERLSEAM